MRPAPPHHFGISKRIIGAQTNAFSATIVIFLSPLISISLCVAAGFAPAQSISAGFFVPNALSIALSKAKRDLHV